MGLELLEQSSQGPWSLNIRSKNISSEMETSTNFTIADQDGVLVSVGERNCQRFHEAAKLDPI